MADDACEAAESPGKRLHAALTRAYDLEEWELALLDQACKTLDLCGTLEGALDADGALMATRAGVRAHPAAVELRAQRIVFARLVAALRIPLEADDEGRPRLQRRGPRGVYGLGAA